MISIRDANLDDAGRILEIYDYYVSNTAITFEYTAPSADVFSKDVCRTLWNIIHIWLFWMMIIF